ncbi:hypothetical protein ACQ4M3_05450 [Leptolyngbya sp. AN03gr2]|uniref:hypothetical protein n=1 Tax=unclassified Leptolyngbya TaxID=2650499 RepID=UPI003D3211BF
MSAFVGFKQNVSESDLKQLLKQYDTAKSCYFLRWAHRVSGIELDLPEEFPSPEGQMFDRDRELRWKQQGERFNVLILSIHAEAGFTAIDKVWTTKSYQAKLYPPTETRFPEGIQGQGVNVAQRCFIDDQTSTVHFVALTAED